MIERIALRIIHNIGTSTSILIHTILFIVPFILIFFGVSVDRVLLVFTLIVSLEAIYLSLFIQMSVNIQTKKILDGVENIQEDVGEIQEDVGEIQEGVEDIQEDQEDEEEDDKDIQEIKKTLKQLMKINTTLFNEINDLKKQTNKI